MSRKIYMYIYASQKRCSEVRICVMIGFILQLTQQVLGLRLSCSAMGNVLAKGFEGTHLCMGWNHTWSQYRAEKKKKKKHKRKERHPIRSGFDIDI